MQKFNVGAISDVVIMQADCAAILLKNHGETHVNTALYHISVIFRVMLMVVCRKHKIEYTNDDSTAFLFDKTYRLLPPEISDMAEDVCYWHNDLQYESTQAKTNDEAMQIGKAMQNYYNDTIVPYLTELKAEEAETSTGIKPLAII